MIYFIIGAVFCVLQTVFRGGSVGFARFLQMPHPFQALAFAVVAGAAVYGTILWLVFGLLLGW